MKEETPNTWELYTVKVSEYQECNTELGTEKSISIKNQVMLGATFGLIDQTPPNNGYSTSCMVEPANSSSKDGLLTSEWEYGEDSLLSQLPFIWLDHSSDRENMITTLMTTSISLIEEMIDA